MKIWESLSIRVKLTSAFLFTLLILFFINLFLYMNVNSMLERVNEVYQSNSSLNELSETLEKVQNSMTEYLSVKSTDTLEICGNEIMMMERNIRRMTAEYLEVTDEAMQAKRGRNIERYGQKYEEASQKFEYINDWIYSLNNMRFEINTDSYLTLVGSLRIFERFSLVILVLAGIANGFLIYVLARNITGPLTALAGTANQVAGGRLDVELLQARGQDEVAVVTGAFNQMIESIRLNLERTRENMEKEAAMKEKQLMMESHLKDAQLKYLQAQINPHFLFNTLNNIYMLILLSPDRAQCAVHDLSKLLRYVLYESNLPVVPIEKEMDFVRNYVELMRIRLPESMDLKIAIDVQEAGLPIAPLLFISLIENAFKHGVSHSGASYIWIHLQESGGSVRCDIENSYFPKDSADRSGSGIGLTNLRKRLELIYPGKYTFSAQREGASYHVKLNLQIK